MAFETLIDAGALKVLLDADPPPVICDCRFDLADAQAGRRAFVEGHVPGARFADLNRELSAPVGPTSGRHPLPDPLHFAATLGRLGVTAASQVVVYDQANGSFAARLWWMLRWVGHRTVAVLDGGFSAWLASGGAAARGEEAPSRAPPYPVRVRSELLVTADDVARNLGEPGRLLIDARAPERYAGSVEPIDARAGHVPGAVNAPFSANLSADGRFLPRTQLEALWRQRLGSRPPSEVVAMCGSGVTACHDILSLEVAGLSGARLYAGSWSEWIRDPAHPVATGESA